MSEQDIPPNIRQELIRNCERSKCRGSEFTRGRPTKWNPGSVKDPTNDGYCFTDMTAWDYVVTLLKNGTFVEQMLLRIPPDKMGYVIKAPQPDGQIIYIKLQLAKPGVIGRSFHYSIAP